MAYRFTLEPYKGMKSRYRCPECNKGKTFSRYVNRETGEHLADHVGRCNRVDNCGNHYTPKQYFQDNNISFDKQQPGQFYKLKATPPPKPVSFIPVDVFKETLKSYNENNFVKFLLGLFGSKIAGKLISSYFIGTSKHWQGATDFWQINLRKTLKEIMRKEFEQLPETLKELEPKERLNILCKLMPLVFPKVEAVHPTDGEPFSF